MNHIHLTTNELNYNPNSRTFSQEISNMDIHFAPIIPIFLTNPNTGVSKLYEYTKADMDGSNEDTYGWRYKNEETGTKLLIIND